VRDKGAIVSLAAAMSTSSSDDEDVPSPAAAVLARRASRKVKPLREESGTSDEDAEEPEEWERDDEATCSEEEGEVEERVSNAQRGRERNALRTLTNEYPVLISGRYTLAWLTHHWRGRRRPTRWGCAWRGTAQMAWLPSVTRALRATATAAPSR